MLDATSAAATTTAAAATTTATTATADAAAAAEATTTEATSHAAPPASDAAAGAAAIGVDPATIVAILTQLVEVLNQLVALLSQNVLGGGGFPGQAPDQKGGPFGTPGQGPTQGGKPGQVPGDATQVGGANGGAPVQSAMLQTPLHWFPSNGAGSKGAKEARAQSSSGNIVTVVREADGSYHLANPTGRGETIAIDGTFAHFDANGRFVQTGAVNGQRMGIVDRSNAVQVMYGSHVDLSKPVGQVETTSVFIKSNGAQSLYPKTNQTPVFIKSDGAQSLHPQSTQTPVFIKSDGSTTKPPTTQAPVFIQSSGVNTQVPLGSSSGSTNTIVSNYSNASTTGTDNAADDSTAANSPGNNVPPGQNGGGDHTAPPAPTGLGAGLPAG